ncbi:reverse transcriptase [Tanacetum coccineum]
MSRMAKIEFPKFYGDDPTGWVYRCNQFFKVDVVEDDPKVEVPETQAISFFLGRLDKEVEMSNQVPQVSSVNQSFNKNKPVYNNAPQRKQLTQKELDDKRAKNQCFTMIKDGPDSRDCEDETEVQCNEWVFGYEDKEVEMETGEPNDCNNESDIAAQPQISLMQSQNTFQTMRVKGQINNQSVNILLRMEFMYQGKKVAIRGAPQPVLSIQAELMSIGIDTDLKTNVHPCLNPLLHKYSGVFVVPKSLPPHTKHDHRIPLQDKTSPINIRPYRHPSTQKDAIEAMVKELLDSGVIRSQSFFFTNCDGKEKGWVMEDALMSEVFAPFLRKFVLVFFDDILVYSRDMVEHAKHMDLVLSTMQFHQLFAKMSVILLLANIFTQKNLHLSGLTNSDQMAFDDLKNYKGLSSANKKTSIAFRADLGTRHKAVILRNEHSCIIYDEPFAGPLWGGKAHLQVEVMFGLLEIAQGLKNAVAYWLVQWSNGNANDTTWEVSTGDSKQKLKGFLGLTGYYRRFVKDYATISWPLTALLKKNSIEWSNSAQMAFDDLKTAMINAFVLALPNFQEEFIVETDASNEDALSMSPLPSLQAMVITDISNDLLQRIKASWELDPSIQQIINKVKNRPVAGSKFKWQDELRRNDKLLIGADVDLRKELLKFYHDEPFGGHYGVEATYKRIDLFTWEKIILVIIDRLGKYGHFIPLSHPFKAAQIAQIFLDTVYKLHGLPKTITSDRDKIFISTFWKDLFKKLGITL